MAEAKSRFSSLETAPRDQAAAARGAPLRDVFYYMDEGVSRELEGNHEKALTCYSAALGEDPLHAEAWVRQLWMLLYLREPIEARMWADKALESFPNHPDILALKSLALWRSGLRSDATALNDAALAISRECETVWISRGELQLAAARKTSQACFRHALARSKNKGLTNLRIGDILLGRKKYAEAAPYLREATNELSHSAWAWYGYGRAQRHMGKESVALAAFRQAQDLSPRDTRYRRVLQRKRSLLERLRGWWRGRDN